MTSFEERAHSNELPLLNTSIIRLSNDELRILGGQCTCCGQLHYPCATYCIICGHQVEEKTFSTEGTVYSFTTVQTKAPYGLPVPYTVGYIELKENGLRVFGLFSPEVSQLIEIGTNVDVELQALGLDGQKQPCMRPVFTTHSREGAR